MMLNWINSTLAIVVMVLAMSGTVCEAQLDAPILVGPKIEGKATAQQLDAARMKLQQAKSTFETNQKLSRRGSVSQFALRRSQYQFEIAKLELDVYEHPELSFKARAEIAKRKLQLAKEEFEKGKRLSRSGSVSKIGLLRLEYRVKYAEVIYKASTREYSPRAARRLIADAKLELAKVELQLGRQLYQTGSLSNSRYQALIAKVREAELEKSEIERLYKKLEKSIKKSTRT